MKVYDKFVLKNHLNLTNIVIERQFYQNINNTITLLLFI